MGVGRHCLLAALFFGGAVVPIPIGIMLIVANIALYSMRLSVVFLPLYIVLISACSALLTGGGYFSWRAWMSRPGTEDLYYGITDHRIVIVTATKQKRVFLHGDIEKVEVRRHVEDGRGDIEFATNAAFNNIANPQEVESVLIELWDKEIFDDNFLDEDEMDLDMLGGDDALQMHDM